MSWSVHTHTPNRVCGYGLRDPYTQGVCVGGCELVVYQFRKLSGSQLACKGYRNGKVGKGARKWVFRPHHPQAQT